MIKFKDLYVSLESEVPAQGPVSGLFCAFTPWTPILLPPQPQPPLPGPFAWQTCPQNNPNSISGVICWTPVVGGLQVQGGQKVAGGAGAAPMPLKDYLKMTLENVGQESKPINALDALQQLEDKLSGALEEVRARKAEMQASRK